MIVGIGIDAVEIERFKDFHKHPNLERLFSAEERAYCLKEPIKSAERFAARFATKEALYKALTQAMGRPPAPFFTLCKHTNIQLNPGPSININYKTLNIPSYSILATITHTKNNALAQVIVQETMEKS
jgi:holo-[acyl-carrier protein] synthase